MREGLYERDWLYILDSIYKMNKTEDVTLFRRFVLERLDGLIPCSHAVFFLAKREDNRVYSSHPVGLRAPEDNLKKFVELRYDDDEYFYRYYYDSQLKVFRDSDMSSDEFRHKTKMFRDIYQKENAYYGLRSVLVADGALLGYIAMFRNKDSEDFSMLDVRVLTVLTDHITLKLSSLLDPFSNNISQKYDDDITAKYMNRYSLTKKEAEVALMLRKKYEDEQICAKMNISLSTLQKHIYKIYKKTGVKNRVQLIKLI